MRTPIHLEAFPGNEVMTGVLYFFQGLYPKNKKLKNKTNNLNFY